MWKHSLTLQDKMKYCGRLILAIFILLYTVTSEIWGLGGFVFAFSFVEALAFIYMSDLKLSTSMKKLFFIYFAFFQNYSVCLL